jgi:hypothetical protein
MLATYFEMDVTNNVVTLPVNKWTTVTGSYSFLTYISLTDLP